MKKHIFLAIFFVIGVNGFTQVSIDVFRKTYSYNEINAAANRQIEANKNLNIDASIKRQIEQGKIDTLELLLTVVVFEAERLDQNVLNRFGYDTMSSIFMSSFATTLIRAIYWLK